eukprot:1530903-Rhodomonas_salina.1
MPAAWYRGRNFSRTNMLRAFGPGYPVGTTQNSSKIDVENPDCPLQSCNKSCLAERDPVALKISNSTVISRTVWADELCSTKKHYTGRNPSLL